MRRSVPQAEEKMDAPGLEGLIGKHHENAIKRVMAGGTLSDAELKAYRRILQQKRRAEKLKQIETPGGLMGPEEARHSTRVRRRRVYEMVLKRYTVREMCEELPAALATVVEDMKCIREELAASIDLTQATRILNEKVAEFATLKSMAAATLDEVDADERAPLLSVIARIVGAEIELLQDAGILSKAALKTEIIDKGGKLQQTAPLIEVSMEPAGEDEFPEEKIVYLDQGQQVDQRKKRRA
jgi:hypothetical protein